MQFYKITFLFFIFSIILISPIFASDVDNDFDDGLMLEESNLISETTNIEVYFDSSVSVDGNGSQENPYKYLNSTSLNKAYIAYLSDGEYTFDSQNFTVINDLILIGNNPKNTIINNFKINNDYYYFNLTLRNITFNNAHILNFGKLNIENCFFINNNDCLLESYKFLDSNNSKVLIKNCTFSNISSKNSIIYIGNCDISIINSLFNNNYYTLSGIISFNSNVYLNHSNICSNFCDYYGFIYSNNNNNFLINSNFFNKSAHYGGVFYSLNSNLIMSDCNFSSNSANLSGGVLYDADSSLINITDCDFFNNSAHYGGVIGGYMNSSININTSRFSCNFCVFDEGGVVYINESSLNVFNSSFTDSFASFGGVICNLKSNTTIKNSIFKDNSAKYDGGVIYNMYSILNISDSIFESNFAFNGGGIYFDNSTGIINSSEFVESSIYSFYKNNLILDNLEYFNVSDYSLNHVSDNRIFVGNYSNINNLTDYFDGRSLGLVSSVKNQNDGGNCWAFASLSTLESCLLKINSSNTFDFSEENMKNTIARFSDYGLNTFTNGGGNFLTVSGYLSSWLGPVNETLDVYCPTSSLSPIFDSELHIQNIYYVPKNVDSIKEAVFKYGAVFYGFLYNSSYLNGASYNCNNYTGGGHAVSIVGWDDNYSSDNFNHKPHRNGAWICKNSWGENTGDNGYLYISYESNILEIFTFILNDTMDYNHNYQYDVAVSDLNNRSSSIWFSNNFTSTENEVLKAVSTYFLSSYVDYEFFIKVNNNIVHSQTGFMHNAGYFTIPLTKPVLLNVGDNFEVIFHLSNYYNVSFPFCDDSSVTHIFYPKNSSRCSHDGSNWTVLDDKVVCVKAFTIVNKTNTNIIPLNHKIFSHNTFNEIVFNVLNSYNTSVKTGKLHLNIDGKDYYCDVINGIGKFKNIPLNKSFYNSTVYYMENSIYSQSNISYNFMNQKFLDYNLSVIDKYYGLEQKIHLTLSDNTSLIVEFNNTNYTMNNSDVVSFGFLNPGTYQVNLYANDSSYYLFKNVFSFVVSSETYLLVCNNVTKYYSSTQRLYVQLIHTNNQSVDGKKVNILINGILYERTVDSNGFTSIALNLNSGEYIVTTTFNNGGYNISVTCYVVILPTIHAQNVVKVFRNATQYYAFVTDSEGNPLINTSVTFNINGVFYNRNTNDSGWAKLNLNLEKGNYIITATNTITGEMISNNITIISRLETNDLVKYYRNDSQFIVRVVGDNGSYVGAGEIVTFNINGVFYNRVTNESGYVKLNINIEPSIYTITSMHRDCIESNTINVLNILYADDLYMHYMDGSQFVVRLIDGQGMPYPEQEISFNINGVFYHRITNYDGEARLNIRLQPGTYIISSAWNYAHISNTITITD